MRNKVLLSILLLMVGGIVFGQTRYNAVVEWNGPYFHVINDSSQDQKVDDPVIDYTFSSPRGIAAINSVTNTNADTLTRIFAIDEDNNRIVLFESQIRYKVIDESQWVFDTTANLPTYGNATVRANSTGDSDTIYLPHTSNHLYGNGGLLYRIVRGSVIVKIDGIKWKEVASLTGFTYSDSVYQVDYTSTSGYTPEIFFPGGSFSNNTTPLKPDQEIEVYYAFYQNNRYTKNRTNTALAEGYGDVDYGLTKIATGTSEVQRIEISEASTDAASKTGITSTQRLKSLAINENKSAAGTLELYVLDMDDNSASKDEHLYMYTVNANTGALDFRPNPDSTLEKYDDKLSYPEDIFVAKRTNQAPHADAAPAVALAGTYAGLNGATVIDANQLTGHTYIYTYSGNTTNTYSVYDQNTGRYVVPLNTTFTNGRSYVIPGVVLNLYGTSATVTAGTITTTAAEYNQYVFIADSGNNRIKILKMADVDNTNHKGDWLDGDEIVAVKDSFATSANYETSYTPATTGDDFDFFLCTSPVKEGSIDTIRIGDYTWKIDPDNDLRNNDANDSLYSVDYLTGQIKFGDGVNGAVPPANKPITYTYTTSVDLVRYGSFGTGAGQFAHPTGITARWNTTLDKFDVYVSDTDNNRIQKFYFDPGDPLYTVPPTFEYVCQWDYASSSTDKLWEPGDIYCVKEGAATALDTVWLFVNDVRNDRVVAYRDKEAVEGGGSATPVFDRIIGGSGTELGKFITPSGITAVANSQAANGFDLYVADSDRDVIMKFEEAAPVIIDVLDTGLPDTFPTQGQYTINYHIAGAFDCAYVNFYYSVDSLYSLDDGLIVAENTIPGDVDSNQTYTWVFSESPGGTPPDGDYYIIGRLVDCESELLDDDFTTKKITLDSSLKTALTVLDGELAGDTVTVLHNDGTKNIYLTMEYPIGVNSIHITGTYPIDTDNMFDIVSITEGNIYDLEGEHISTIFSSDYDSVLGTFEISFSQVGDPDGSNVSKGTVAVISIKARHDMVTPEFPVVTGAITIDPVNSSIVKWDGSTDDNCITRSMTIYGAYLGDIATPGADQGEPPTLYPLPDGEIGFADQMIWTWGWNGDTIGNHDPIADLAPTGGIVPDLYALPDGYLTELDLFALTEMFSWWTSNFVPKLAEDYVGVAKSVSVETFNEDNLVRAKVLVDDIEDMMGAHMLINYDREDLRYIRVEDGGMLTSGDASSFTLTRERGGILEIGVSRLSSERPTVSGDGVIVDVIFERLSEESEITFSYELADNKAHLFENGAGKAVPGGKEAKPVAVSLLQNVPNPFNPKTTIAFDIVETGHVNVSVYDIRGNFVNNLINEDREAGRHSVTWDGDDSKGNKVPTGEYIVRMKTDDGNVQSRRMLLLK